MKKTLLGISLIASNLVLAPAAFAENMIDVMPTVPPVLKPAQTTIHWVGSISDIIPGDNIVITGGAGSVEIPSGDLNLQTNGTFESTEIVLETHKYDATSQTVAPELTAATWTLQSVNYTWGENQVSNAEVQVFNKNAGVIESNRALIIGEEIAGITDMSLQVKNIVPLDITDISDTAASAKVVVTMTAAFPA
ncbi:hypothetical protein GNP82_12900 [Aliivibrio fischeri]|uniref:hypothetical protein n=1 Tax=Aliivibrio fischeri TaxID=668 RepID=UPI0012D9D95B|nr:hypothetical protein [Aliivibrio fischeri]MUJ20977.1 hypothetical protein [Aliivibrio fischeri]MUK38452.1 hypothetical protein [Aliivibrio fischeri]MUL04534.1 hypothetical protein [Aliivibrio fischeri]MUL16506.1 hypothetical protein [Aliivibrio fischeri]